MPDTQAAATKTSLGISAPQGCKTAGAGARDDGAREVGSLVVDEPAGDDDAVLSVGDAPVMA